MSEIPEVKEIIEKIGTNRALAGKKIGFDFIAPYSECNKYKAFKEAKEKMEDQKQKGKPAEKAGLPVWWRIPESNR